MPLEVLHKFIVHTPVNTPLKIDMEPKNHPIEKEHHLNQTSIFRVHVDGRNPVSQLIWRTSHFSQGFIDSRCCMITVVSVFIPLPPPKKICFWFSKTRLVQAPHWSSSQEIVWAPWVFWWRQWDQWVFFRFSYPTGWRFAIPKNHLGCTLSKFKREFTPKKWPSKENQMSSNHHFSRGKLAVKLPVCSRNPCKEWGAFFTYILLMEEILHQLRCIRPCK